MAVRFAAGPRIPRRRCRPPPPADRRPGADERDPGRRTTCAGSSPPCSPAMPHRRCWTPTSPSAAPARAQRPALARERRQPLCMIEAAVGVSHENTEEQNLASLRRALERHAGGRRAPRRGAASRSAPSRWSSTSTTSSYGYHLRVGRDRLRAGGRAAPSVDPIRIYEPSTRPGITAPARLDRRRGRTRRPIKDLVAPGAFLLIAGEEGEDWCEAARELAEATHLPLDGAADRAPRRRPVRPALRLAAPARDSAPRARSSCDRTASSPGAAWARRRSPCRLSARRSARSSPVRSSCRWRPHARRSRGPVCGRLDRAPAAALSPRARAACRRTQFAVIAAAGRALCNTVRSQ